MDNSYVNSDIRSAKKWFSLAAKNGLPEAQNNLASIFFEGIGVPQNFQKAFSWYKSAAINGIVLAQSRLAYLYYKGWGIKKDITLAHVWWNMAASLGHEDSKTRRDEVQKEMSKKEIESAQEISKKCLLSEYKDCS